MTDVASPVVEALSAITPESGEPGSSSVTPGATESTVIEIGELVKVLPAASETTIRRSYGPLGRPPTFHVVSKGALPSLATSA